MISQEVSPVVIGEVHAGQGREKLLFVAQQAADRLGVAVGRVKVDAAVQVRRPHHLFVELADSPAVLVLRSERAIAHRNGNHDGSARGKLEIVRERIQGFVARAFVQAEPRAEMRENRIQQNLGVLVASCHDPALPARDERQQPAGGLEIPTDCHEKPQANGLS